MGRWKDQNRNIVNISLRSGNFSAYVLIIISHVLIQSLIWDWADGWLWRSRIIFLTLLRLLLTALLKAKEHYAFIWTLVVKMKRLEFLKTMHIAACNLCQNYKVQLLVYKSWEVVENANKNGL